MLGCRRLGGIGLRIPGFVRGFRSSGGACHELLPTTGLSHTGEGSVVASFLAPMLTPKQLSESIHSEFGLDMSKSGVKSSYRQNFIHSGPGLGDSRILGGVPAVGRVHMQVLLEKARSAGDIWKKEPKDHRDYLISEFIRVSRVHQSNLVDLLVMESGLHYGGCEVSIENGLESLENCHVDIENSHVDTANSHVDTANSHVDTTEERAGEVLAGLPTDANEVFACLKRSLRTSELPIIILTPPSHMLFCLGLKLIFEYIGAANGVLTFVENSSGEAFRHACSATEGQNIDVITISRS